MSAQTIALQRSTQLDADNLEHSADNLLSVCFRRAISPELSGDRPRLTLTGSWSLSLYLHAQ